MEPLFDGIAMLISGCKKTELFSVFDKNRACELNEVKTSKIRLAKFLKPRSLLSVNDCFKNEYNAIFGVFLQRLITATGLFITLLYLKKIA